VIFPSRFCGLGVAGWELAGTDREHAAEAQAAWAAGLHGSGGALLGVVRSRGNGGPPAPGSSSPLENGSKSVLRLPLPSIAVSPFSLLWTRCSLAFSPRQGEEQQRRYFQDMLCIDQDPPSSRSVPDGEARD